VLPSKSENRINCGEYILFDMYEEKATYQLSSIDKDKGDKTISKATSQFM